MTVGIYSLYWEEQDLIYIGKSQKIEVDFKHRHCGKALKGIHSNYKVQNAYNKFGIPKLTILEVCKVSELSPLEIVWTYEFDSLNRTHGLNIVEPGDFVGIGVHSANSQYSKVSILRIFSLLYKNNLSYSKISEKLGISLCVIKHISNEESHLWLKEEYPEKYLLMQNRTTKLGKVRKSRIQSIDLVSPDSIVYKDIKNMAEFCRTIPEFSLNVNNSRKGLSLVISGERNSYFGWKVYQC